MMAPKQFKIPYMLATCFSVAKINTCLSSTNNNNSNNNNSDNNSDGNS